MKILIINGSARTNGFCNTIADKLVLELNKLDGGTNRITTSVFTIAKKNINFCLGCVKCCANELNYCIIKDDIYEAYKIMESSDIIVFISPIYECFLSGILKNFFDRTNHYTSFYKLAGKNINFILCGVQSIDCKIKEFSNKHVIKNIRQYLRNYSIITHTKHTFLGFIHHEDHHSIRNEKNIEKFDSNIRHMAKRIISQKPSKKLIEKSKIPYKL